MMVSTLSSLPDDLKALEIRPDDVRKLLQHVTSRRAGLLIALDRALHKGIKYDLRFAWARWRERVAWYAERVLTPLQNEMLEGWKEMLPEEREPLLYALVCGKPPKISSEGLKFNRNLHRLCRRARIPYPPQHLAPASIGLWKEIRTVVVQKTFGLYFGTPEGWFWVDCNTPFYGRARELLRSSPEILRDELPLAVLAGEAEVIR